MVAASYSVVAPCDGSADEKQHILFRQNSVRSVSTRSRLSCCDFRMALQAWLLGLAFVVQLQTLGKVLLACSNMWPGLSEGIQGVRTAGGRKVWPGLSGDSPGLSFSHDS